MNLYVFRGNREIGEYGLAVVLANSAAQARQIMSDEHAPVAGKSASVRFKLSKTVSLKDNTRSQYVAGYFE